MLLELVKTSGPYEMAQCHLWGYVRLGVFPVVGELGFLAYCYFPWYSNKKFETIFNCTDLSSCKVGFYIDNSFFLAVVALAASIDMQYPL